MEARRYLEAPGDEEGLTALEAAITSYPAVSEERTTLALGTQFTCFTGTKVQMMTLVVEHHAIIEVLLTWDSQVNPMLTCFTGTKAQILTLLGAGGRW